MLDADTCRLWETYHSYPLTNGEWDIYGSASFDLRSSGLRPAGWTSADAAGFPILPLLLGADEAATGEIEHALRFTILSSKIRNTLCLARTSGFYLADGGSDLYVKGEPSGAWAASTFSEVQAIGVSQVEAVDVTDLQAGRIRSRLGGGASVATGAPRSSLISSYKTFMFEPAVASSAAAGRVYLIAGHDRLCVYCRKNVGATRTEGSGRRRSSGPIVRLLPGR